MRKFDFVILLSLFMLSSLLILSGCSNTSETGKSVISSENTPVSANASNTSNKTDASSASDASEIDAQASDASSHDETYAVFMSKSPSLADLAIYVDTHVSSASSELANQMLQDWIVMLDLSSSERDTVFYGGDSELYYNELASVASSLYTTYGSTLFMGSQKEDVAAKIKNPDVQNYLYALYKEGYGLTSSEGLFYAYPDYIYILEHYGLYASKSLNQYLNVLVTEIQEPLFAEETLNVSVETLFERTYYYETLFANTPDLHEKLRINLASLLNMCYYRLLVPSSYDMLDDEHRVSESLKTFYQAGANHTETPVTAALCKEMLAFFDEKNNVLNVFDDPSIYDHANQYFEDALGNSLHIGE
ncbi:hypothetical protein [Fusibacter ferrireducens]|uniref:Uncharacterized protein n=1 Tax=Fusibacter ferrireducens TaxID=2785058 RepID=A0ABR9ZV29_9FIRM|nr:hypothetical protein [Fusibacter ferrireducens]MBF4694295.1 hypothetical protein [Fusibacter ferrireducens]